MVITIIVDNNFMDFFDAYIFIIIVMDATIVIIANISFTIFTY